MRWPRSTMNLLSVCFALWPVVANGQNFQGSHPLVAYDVEIENYGKVEATNVVTHLQKSLETGAVALAYEDQHGYLLSLLQELKAPVSSQLLVFSKTSLQRPHISSKSPRAIFFNDRVYVAWIPAAPMIEILAFDPRLGAVLYTLEQKKETRPRPRRNDRCLECHVTSKTLDVPGPLIRSFKTSHEGEVDLLSGDSVADHRHLIDEPWGGWYVTGTYGTMIHRANFFSNTRPGQRDRESGAATNGFDLSRYFDVSTYPRSSSDIVPLLIFEHQTHMQNLLTRLNYEARAALRQWGHVRYLDGLGETFLKHLLFTDEAPITSPIQGSAEFIRRFESDGPKDKQGRSLRQLDLQTRLFKFPCSYLIYSEAFDQLPRELKLHLYRRLWKILAGEDSAFGKIPAETKHIIRDILTETKSGLPLYWTMGD